jgi:hypothetical protein
VKGKNLARWVKFVSVCLSMFAINAAEDLGVRKKRLKYRPLVCSLVMEKHREERGRRIHTLSGWFYITSDRACAPPLFTDSVSLSRAIYSAGCDFSADQIQPERRCYRKNNSVSKEGFCAPFATPFGM